MKYSQWKSLSKKERKQVRFKDLPTFKKATAIIVYSFLALILIGIFSPKSEIRPEPQKTTVVGEMESKVDPELIKKIEIEIMTNEPGVKVCSIVDQGIMYASMINDGTRRDGFAEYLCQVLNEDYPDAKVEKVIIVELWTHKAPNRNSKFGIHLGESNCDFSN